MKKLPYKIDILKGKYQGPCVVVMGAIHGNETIGGSTIVNLHDEIDQNKLHGDLILILGNPRAFAISKRFIDCDLNRLFGNDLKKLVKKSNNNLNTEEKRAVEIVPFLQKADYLLDIHSTIKPSIPFVYSENTKEHLALASLFDTRYVVSSHADFRPPDLTNCADTFVDRNGGIGITYEAGWHKNPATHSEVMEKTYKFLTKVGSIQRPLQEKAKKRFSQLFIYGHLVPKTRSFQFMKNHKNFDIVHADEVIAKDGGEIIKVQKDSFIIFPKMDLIVGKPACYLATQ